MEGILVGFTTDMIQSGKWHHLVHFNGSKCKDSKFSDPQHIPTPKNVFYYHPLMWMHMGVILLGGGMP